MSIGASSMRAADVSCRAGRTFARNQTTSIFGQADVPAIVLDPAGLRCAFADDTAITVLQSGTT
jgi:hypothetical protein